MFTFYQFLISTWSNWYLTSLLANSDIIFLESLLSVIFDKHNAYIPSLLTYYKFSLSVCISFKII